MFYIFFGWIIYYGTNKFVHYSKQGNTFGHPVILNSPKFALKSQAVKDNHNETNKRLCKLCIKLQIEDNQKLCGKHWKTLHNIHLFQRNKEQEIFQYFKAVDVSLLH